MSSQKEMSPLAIKWPRSLIYDQNGDNIKLFRDCWKGQGFKKLKKKKICNKKILQMFCAEMLKIKMSAVH